MLLDNLKVYKSQHYKLFYEHKEKRGIVSENLGQCYIQFTAVTYKRSKIN